MSLELPERRFEVTLPPGFARRAARDVVRTQLTRWQLLLGYLLVAVLIVLGAVTGVWLAVVIGVLCVAVVVLVWIRRTAVYARAYSDGGLTDGHRLVSEYRADELTIRGDERSGTVRYADVWEVHRYRDVVDLELRRHNVRHILPVELVPVEMQSRFAGKPARKGLR